MSSPRRPTEHEVRFLALGIAVFVVVLVGIVIACLVNAPSRVVPTDDQGCSEVAHD